MSQEQLSIEMRKYVLSPPSRGHISEFESGKRIPNLLILLGYAKLAGISTDLLIDDDEELPDSSPAISQTSL